MDSCIGGIEGFERGCLGDRAVLVRGKGSSWRHGVPDAFTIAVNPVTDALPYDIAAAADAAWWLQDGNVEKTRNRPILIPEIPDWFHPLLPSDAPRTLPVDGDFHKVVLPKVPDKNGGERSQVRVDGSTVHGGFFLGVACALWLTEGPVVVVGCDLDGWWGRYQKGDAIKEQTRKWGLCANRGKNRLFVHPGVKGPVSRLLPKWEGDTMEHQAPDTWVVVGSGPSRDKWREVGEALGGNISIACGNEALNHVPRADVYLQADPDAVSKYPGEAARARATGADVRIGLKEINKGLPMWEARARTVSIHCLRHALHRGAKKVVICGCDGWGPEDMAYTRLTGRRASRHGSNENQAWNILLLARMYPDVEITFAEPGPVSRLVESFRDVFKPGGIAAEERLPAIVINMDSRRDRWNDFTKQNLPWDVERFPAVEHQAGWAGCTLSHLRIMELYAEGAWGDSPLVVLEDDCMFLDGWEAKYKEAMGELPDDWDILYLGGKPKKKVSYHSPALARVDGSFMYTHAMIINSKRLAAETRKIYRKTPDWEKGPSSTWTIDQVLANEIQPKFNCFCCRDLLAAQRPGWSDLEKRDVDNVDFLTGVYAGMVEGPPREREGAVILVGGGPSLERMWNLVISSKLPRFCINNSIQMVDNPDFWFANDLWAGNKFPEWIWTRECVKYAPSKKADNYRAAPLRRRRMFQVFQDKLMFKTPVDIKYGYDRDTFLTSPGIQTGAPWRTGEYKIINGNKVRMITSSFLPALRLAVDAGFKDIYLAGVDLECPEDGQFYPYDATSVDKDKESVRFEFVKAVLWEQAPLLEAMGVHVWNCNPSGSASMFPHKDLPA